MEGDKKHQLVLALDGIDGLLISSKPHFAPNFLSHNPPDLLSQQLENKAFVNKNNQQTTNIKLEQKRVYVWLAHRVIVYSWKINMKEPRASASVLSDTITFVECRTLCLRAGVTVKDWRTFGAKMKKRHIGNQRRIQGHCLSSGLARWRQPMIHGAETVGKYEDINKTFLKKFW